MIQTDCIVGPFTFDEAWLYCACLYSNGFSDWRIPTTDEYITDSKVLGWSQGDERRYGSTHAWRCCPVRTV